MAMDINTALHACAGLSTVCRRLETLASLGLGYLTLGEATPNLSGGEAQRLKLAGEMTRAQSDTVFVFDEPTIGLHPLDVETLLGVINCLIENGATVVVIEHDLDVIRNADWFLIFTRPSSLTKRAGASWWPVPCLTSEIARKAARGDTSDHSVRSAFAKRRRSWLRAFAEPRKWEPRSFRENHSAALL